MTTLRGLNFTVLKSFLYRKESLLFIFAFGVRFAFFVFLIWWFLITGHYPSFGSDFPVLGGDSADYATLTHNLFQYGTFSSSDSFTLIHESFRLPGYSFFLYLFEFLPFSLFFAMLAQIAIASGSVVLIYLFGKKFLSEKTGLIAALLLSLEPISILNSVIVMSDTVFVFAMLLGLYLLFYRPPTLRQSLSIGFLAGIVFGYAVLVRVIAQYLAVLLIPAYLVLFHKDRPLGATLLKLVVFTVGMVIVIAPWSIRNYKQFNTFTISSTPYINFTQYNLVYFYAYQHQTTPPEVQHLFSDPIPYPTSSFWFRSLINEPIFQKEMHDGLQGNLIPYAKFHLVKTLPFFLNDGLRDINLVTGFLPQPTEVTNFTDLLLHKEYGKIFHYFITPQPSLWLLIVGSSFWISIGLLWIGGIVYAAFKRSPKLWFMIVASGIILYFAVLSSPVIQSRYRMPAAPFMLLLAAESLVLLYPFISGGRKREAH